MGNRAPMLLLAVLSFLLWGHVKSRDELYTPEAVKDRVSYLPGWGSVDFGLYSGYITVDSTAKRSLFYVFVEAPGNAGDDLPVVLWLNGGPGCSSLAGGFLSELGPFFPKPQVWGGEIELQANPHAWSQVANIIFLESPAFVGWSYSERKEDVRVGDARTAQDSWTFLQQFFQRFPQYKGREFWITGESYGGHYVPNLALEIMTKNDQAESPVNLKGFLVGNPWTDPLLDNRGAVDYWFSHALISRHHRDQILKYCDLTINYDLKRGVFRTEGDEGEMGTDRPGGMLKVRVSSTLPMSRKLMGDIGTRQQGGEELAEKGGVRYDSKKCEKVIMECFKEMGSINIYNIYEDTCPADRARSEARQLSRVMAAQPSALGATAVRVVEAQRVRQTVGGRLFQNQDPCIDDEVAKYFNRPDVQAALHANISGMLPGPWTGCSTVLQYNEDDLFVSMLPVYDQLINSKKLRIIVYSGDVDGMVPVSGTRLWVSALNRTELHPWRPWYSSNGDTGGYVVEYDGLALVTVRDAGHMVPYSQPLRALDLFRRTIQQVGL